MMRYTLLAYALLVLTACSAEHDPSTTPLITIDPVCRHIWQTGYNGIGQLVIGHPVAPCHMEEHSPRSIDEEFIEDPFGIEESPLPILPF